MRITKGFLLACALAVSSIATGGVPSPAAQASGTYVALGDSVAAPPDSYVGLLGGFLRTAEGGGLDTVYNDAMSGADSTTLRTWGQLATAIAQIDESSDTKVVTIDIGGNDRGVCADAWHLPSCPFAANFDAILADLQAALGRDPGSEALVAMTYYNPASGIGGQQEDYYDRGLLGSDRRIYCAPSGDPRLGLNDLIVCIAAARGALVADVYPAFKLGGQALMSLDGIHPNSQGQAVIAEVFRKVLPPAATTPPAPTGPTPTLPVSPPVDTIAPVFSAVSLSASAFYVGSQATAVTMARRRVPTGTTIRYRLSEAAAVRLVIERKLAGRRRGRSCVRPTPALRRAKKCTRYSPKGTLTRASKAGANSVAFSGRIGRKALAPGPYRLTANAKDAAGNSGNVKRLSFRIVAKPRTKR